MNGYFADTARREGQRDLLQPDRNRQGQWPGTAQLYRVRVAPHRRGGYGGKN